MVRGRRFALVGVLIVASVAGVGARINFRSVPSAHRPKLTSALDVGAVVFDDGNGNGLLDDGEGALGGVTVDISSPVAGTGSTGVTDRSGAVTFAVGAVPSVIVGVSIESPAPARTGRTVPVRIEREVRAGEVVDIPLRIVARPCPDLACTGLLLPDLVSLDRTPTFLNDEVQREYPGPDQWYVDRTTSPGRMLLRVATITANVGDGPLLVIGTGLNEGVFTSTVQRVFDASLGYVDIESGTFEPSQAHQHVHLEALEEVRLVGPDGVVAATRKISFCLTDVLPISDAPRGARSVGLALELFDCGTEQQGINSGMADYYGPALVDQFLDVSNVAPGDYTLEIESDPDGVILEADETNNIVSLAVTV